MGKTRSNLGICGARRCKEPAHMNWYTDITLGLHSDWLMARAAVPLCKEHLATVRTMYAQPCKIVDVSAEYEGADDAAS